MPEQRRFGESAARLAGVAGALLGWRPDEFWRSTPAELAAVLRAMAGEEEGLSTADLERLKGMFPDQNPPLEGEVARASATEGYHRRR